MYLIPPATVTANPPTTGYHRLKLACDASPWFTDEEKKCPREVLLETREREWQNLDDMLADDVVSDHLLEIKLLRGMSGSHTNVVPQGISSVQEESFLVFEFRWDTSSMARYVYV